MCRRERGAAYIWLHLGFAQQAVKIVEVEVMKEVEVETTKIVEKEIVKEVVTRT